MSLPQRCRSAPCPLRPLRRLRLLSRQRAALWQRCRSAPCPLRPLRRLRLLSLQRAALQRLASLALLIGLGTGVCGRAETKPAEDVQDIVLLAEARPILVRLHLRVDDRPFRLAHREAWEDCLGRLFKYLDANGDGALSEAESARMPPPLELAPRGLARPTNVAFNFRVVDDDGDGRVTLAELLAFHREQGIAPLQLHAPPGQAGNTAGLDQALFSRLDTNGDDKLSLEELAAASTILGKLDQDENEILTVGELLGVEAVPIPPGVQRAPRRSTPAPILFVSAEDGPGSLAVALKTRYGEQGRKFLDRPPELELVIRLGDRKGKKALEVLAPAQKLSGEAWEASLSPEGTLRLKGGRTFFELIVNEDAPVLAPGTRQNLLDRFRGADVQTPGRMSRKEAGLREFFPALFSLLDQDRDETLTERELTAFLDGVQAPHARALAHSPALLVSDRGTGLFDLLDQDRDGRLSVRELRAAKHLPTRLLSARKGGLDRADLLPSYRLALGLGRAYLRDSGDRLVPRQLPTLALLWSKSSLTWFHAMDRNGDGDVSAKEFLGTRATFRNLDADGDGLIDITEAIRANDRYRK